MQSVEVDQAVLDGLRARALNMRRHMVRMARGPGQGYLGQGLAIADALAALYFHEMRWSPADLQREGRDRFILSTGHYSIALWAVLAEAGVIPLTELNTYGASDSRLAMSTLDTSPGVEMIGGSLGQGLGQAIGMAMGERMRGTNARMFCELSDGELQEGATWEAAMAASHFGLDNLVALIDCNGIQADGPIVLDMEPIREKWSAFGWQTEEIDGNDMGSVVAALARCRSRRQKPHAIILRTKPGCGIRSLEVREKSHFIRVDSTEWDLLAAELNQEAAQ
ncbi:MAG: transketolase [Proteobacteria bacterium]|nr:transketolase [Pseudomonadota bacterium]